MYDSHLLGNSMLMSQGKQCLRKTLPEQVNRDPVEVLTFQASLRNCLSCVITGMIIAYLFSNPQFYMKHNIYHFTSILHGLIRTHKWPVPNVSGFIAQLLRASHRYREVTGSNPVEVLTFQASLRNCLNCVHRCDDHSLLDFKSAVQYMKHFIYHFRIFTRAHSLLFKFEFI